MGLSGVLDYFSYRLNFASAQMTWGGGFYLAAHIVVLGTQNYTVVIFVMVLATLGEVLIAPVVPAFLSDHGGRGAPFYIGLVRALEKRDG